LFPQNTRSQSALRPKETPQEYFDGLLILSAHNDEKYQTTRCGIYASEVDTPVEKYDFWYQDYEIERRVINCSEMFHLN
jgi:hypothetical protein